jgi:hypothetical protein
MNKRLLTRYWSVSAILLFSMVVLAGVSAQTATWELNTMEPLEKYDMPPAYIYRLETSPSNGFAVWRIHKLSGERGREWEQHSRRCCK